LQRFHFVARLIRAAGYAGWVLLLDEIELVGRFTLLQRARSYPEVARWVDERDPAAIPGVAAVLTVSEDFDAAVIEQKDDRNAAPNRLLARAAPGDEELARRAETGIRLLRRNAAHKLSAPDLDQLTSTYTSIRALHGTAYSWTPPELRVEQLETTRPMRQYIRRWISEWDLRRLDPDYQPDIEVEIVATDYGEDAALSAEEEDGGDRAAG
jgi:hypothetical protein